MFFSTLRQCVAVIPLATVVVMVSSFSSRSRKPDLDQAYHYLALPSGESKVLNCNQSRSVVKFYLPPSLTD